METEGPFRDGKVHVREERCTTCVFHPGNRMHLAPGRLKDIVTGNVAAESALQCHQTLDYYGPDRKPPAVCRGFYDAYPTQPLRMATALGMIEFDA